MWLRNYQKRLKGGVSVAQQGGHVWACTSEDLTPFWVLHILRHTASTISPRKVPRRSWTLTTLAPRRLLRSPLLPCQCPTTTDKINTKIIGMCLSTSEDIKRSALMHPSHKRRVHSSLRPEAVPVWAKYWRTVKISGTETKRIVLCLMCRFDPTPLLNSHAFQFHWLGFYSETFSLVSLGTIFVTSFCPLEKMM